MDTRRIKDCIEATIDFVIRFQMTFSIVNNPWFKKLCNVLNQHFVSPLRQYL